jgi:hypothetical protein
MKNMIFLINENIKKIMNFIKRKTKEEEIINNTTILIRLTY